MAWGNRGHTHLLGNAKRYIVTPDFQLLDHKLAKQSRIDGTFFNSGAEAKRWIGLNMMLRSGHVRNLRRGKEAAFKLHVVRPDGMKECIGKWTADFIYEERHPIGPYDGPHPLLGAAGDVASMYRWLEVVEDVKPGGGHREVLYLWKRKHVEAEYGIKVSEFAPRGR